MNKHVCELFNIFEIDGEKWAKCILCGKSGKIEDNKPPNRDQDDFNRLAQRRHTSSKIMEEI